MTHAFPLSGALDGWTSSRGGAYERSLRCARVVMWACTAEQQENDFLKIARLRKSQVPERSALGWRSLSELRRESYLRGEKSPNSATVEAARRFAPHSFVVFHHELWTALSNKADMATCAALQLTKGGEGRARILADVVQKPNDQAPKPSELDEVTLLVASIRLAVGQKRSVDAFRYGIALIYALVLLAVHPLHRHAHADLVKVVGPGVLDGLTDHRLRIQHSADILEMVGSAMRSRCDDLTVLAGGAYRLAYGPPLKPETFADLFHPYAAALCEPSPAIHEDLLGFLERSLGRIHGMAPAALKRLEAMALFARVI